GAAENSRSAASRRREAAVGCGVTRYPRRPETLELLQDPALVLDCRVVLRVVLRQLLQLLAAHLRHDVAVLTALEPVHRQRHRALAETEDSADVDERVQLAVRARARDAGDLADGFALRRHDVVTYDFLRVQLGREFGGLAFRLLTRFGLPLLLRQALLSLLRRALLSLLGLRLPRRLSDAHARLALPH